jgi:hypothetical protein
MVAEMEQHPKAVISWCNQHLDQETEEGIIIRLGTTVHPVVNQRPVQVRNFGEVAQVFGAIHANGAMLLRRLPDKPYFVPETLPFSAMESFRDRQFEGDMLYLSEPLARFTFTCQTARGAEVLAWSAAQTALVASFVRCSAHRFDEDILRYARSRKPKLTGLLIQAALGDSDCRRILVKLKFKELCRWILTAVRRPRKTLAGIQFKQQSWWPELASLTKKQVEKL